jgi:hypothetical protein
LGVVGHCAGGVFGGVAVHLGVVLRVLLEVLGLVVLLAVVLRVPYALESVLGCRAGGLLDVEVAQVELGLGVLLMGGLGVVVGFGLGLRVGGVGVLLLGVQRGRWCG